MSKWTKVGPATLGNALPRFDEVVIVAGEFKRKRWVGAAYLHGLSSSDYYWVRLMPGSWNQKVKVHAWMPLPAAPK